MFDRLSRPLAVVSIALLGAALVVSASEISELRAALDEHFEVLALSDGLLLQARSEEGPRAVQVSRSTTALDGEEVGEEELRARLGDEVADLVLEAGELSESERFDLLSINVTEAVAAAEPADGDEESDEDTGAEVKPDRPHRQKPPRRDRSHRSSGEQEVAFGSSLTVDEDEVTDEVLVVGGFLKVEGRVDGDATVLFGSATIKGTVNGDVTVVGGPIRLEDDSVVHGHVTSVGDKVYRDADAVVHGDIEQVPFSADWSFGDWDRREGSSSRFDFDDLNPWNWWTGIGWTIVQLLFVGALAWLSLLVFKGPIERMERRVAAEPWKTGLVGLLTQVLFFPMLIMLAVFLAISIIGIPLLLVLPFALIALAIVAMLGCVAVAGRVGAWAEERFGWNLGSPFWVVLVGIALIFSLSIIGELLDFGVAPLRFVAGMFLFFGCVVLWAAFTIGVGAAVLTRLGTADSWSRAEDVVAPLPSVPSYTTDAEPESMVDEASEPSTEEE